MSSNAILAGSTESPFAQKHLLFDKATPSNPPNPFASNSSRKSPFAASLSAGKSSACTTPSSGNPFGANAATSLSGPTVNASNHPNSALTSHNGCTFSGIVSSESQPSSSHNSMSSHSSTISTTPQSSINDNTVPSFLGKLPFKSSASGNGPYSSNGARTHSNPRAVRKLLMGQEDKHRETTSLDSGYNSLSLARNTGAHTWLSQKETLQLLTGPSMEMVIGSGTASSKETWHLPRSLISHHSPFLKAACSHNFKEKEESRITLADEDPLIFSLFVEWMYCDTYTLDLKVAYPPHTDEKAWILGDKLMSTAFKNFAMGRIYDAHNIDNILGVSVTESLMGFICDNTVEDAKLRQYYIDFVVTHFSNPHKVLGTTEEWDSILMDFDDVRKALLRAMRSINSVSRVGQKHLYLEELSQSRPKESMEGEVQLKV